MSVAQSLIPELQEVLRRSGVRRRGELAGHIADLFAAGAEQFSAEHVELFDQVLVGLIVETEVKARVALAERMAQFAIAPRGLIGHLARDNEITIAAPVLLHSPVLDDAALIEIARMRGQAHLFAIAGRSALTPSVTDVVLRRGDREVVRELASNTGASFSDHGYSGLVKRAAADAALAVTVGQRADLPQVYLQRLLAGAVDIVRRSVLAGVPPERRADIARVITDITGPPKPQTVVRDFTSAQRTVLDLHAVGSLNEAALQDFARAHKYEEAVASLAAMTGVPIGTVDRMMANARPDSILILCKALTMEWATARAVLALRLGPHRAPSPTDVAEAQSAFEHISPSTAQRVLGFWQAQG